MIGTSDSAFFTSPDVLMRRRAIAIAMFSFPWKYLLATAESIFISTSASQSTSSVHSHRRQASLDSSSFQVMFTTLSRSGKTNRCGVWASRSLGPISGSVDISSKARSMTSRNSSGDLKSLLPIGFWGEPI